MANTKVFLKHLKELETIENRIQSPIDFTTLELEEILDTMIRINEQVLAKIEAQDDDDDGA